MHSQGIFLELPVDLSLSHTGSKEKYISTSKGSSATYLKVLTESLQRCAFIMHFTPENLRTPTCYYF